MKKSEAYLPFKGYKTFYKIVGKNKAGKTPLIILHGGPGSAHNYLLSLADIAKSGRQVIFYDQLGCGLSGRPTDDSIWTIELFLAELQNLREQLNLDQIHLLGHSWGGMLAVEYLLTSPMGVKSAVLASAMISMPLYQQEVNKLKRALPGNTFAVMHKHEQAGTTDSPEYQHAYKIYQDHHLYRGDKFPDEYSVPAANVGNNIYRKMWGPSEAYANGTLRKWDRVKQLSDIKIPSLVISGQYDELTPFQAGITRDHLANAKIAIITNGAHLVHIEQQKAYNSIVSDFIALYD